MFSRYIDIHTHTTTPNIRSILAYSLGIDPLPAAQEVIFCAGIHPWSADQVDSGIETGLLYLEQAPVVAIGEIGLDYAQKTDKQRQIVVFEAQLEIATRRELPVILHCVRAQNDVLSILKRHAALKGAIFHGYTGNDHELSTLLSRGYYISLGELSLRSTKTLDAIKKADRPTLLNRLFLETDMSDLGIGTIYADVAEVLDIPLLDLVESVERNYNKLFL